MEENDMEFDKLKTHELIEIYKKIEDFLKYLEKEENDNKKGE